MKRWKYLQLSRKKLIQYAAGILLLIVLSYGFYITRTTPKDFPIGTTFLINENETLRSVSIRLEEQHVIYSALWFRAWMSFLGKDKHMQLGYYKFDQPQVLGAILKRLIQTGPDMPLEKITVPEGTTSKGVASLVKNVLPEIDVDKFLQIVDNKKAEGYLFPSTYFLLPSNSEESIINKMITTFNKEYDSKFLLTFIPKTVKNKTGVVTLASIIEAEAKDENDMRIISGILQKRLSNNMLLQVDVATSTYKIKGLPESPINNPGINAINAVFNPIQTDYLYYVTGNDGLMHYAKTFAEHKANIIKYLK